MKRYWYRWLCRELLEARRGLAEHNLILARVSAALFPNSPPECAIAEFVLDGEGACQVIRQMHGELAELREAYQSERDFIEQLEEVAGASTNGSIGSDLLGRIAELRKDKERWDKLSRLGVDKLWLADGRELAARGTDLRYIVDEIDAAVKEKP